MMTYLSILIAVLLFVVLAVSLLRARRDGAAGAIEDDEVLSAGAPEAAPEDEGLSAQMLTRVFSSCDDAFVAEEASAGLGRLLRRERKRLALRWVGRRAAEARSIMRRHARLARTARDVQVSGEVQLALRYVELRSLCGLLFVLVSVFGPVGLHGLAVQTNAVLAGIRTLGETAADSPLAG
jgi:hypothetical protein